MEARGIQNFLFLSEFLQSFTDFFILQEALKYLLTLTNN